MRPRAITGSAGSRIKVVLGETGSDYLLLLNEDDGSSEWQNTSWTTEAGGLPNGLANQLNNMIRKGRYATNVAFGPCGEWFISGQKRDGSGAHTWWGGIDSGPSATIKEWAGTKHSLQVCFGEGRDFAIIQGNNGFSLACSGDKDLASRVKRIRNRRKTVKKVCLFPSGGYFISDDEGTEWKACNYYLSNELESGGKDPILDVIKASDGSWIVIRPNRWTYSEGVSSDLISRIKGFYARHQQRQQQRSREITAYDEQLRERQRKEQEAAELLAKLLREAEEAARREKEEAERLAAKQERIKNRREEQERIEQIRNKRLKTGEHVTIVGISEAPGDAIVTSLAETGEVEVVHSPLSKSMIIRDPRVLSAYEEDDEDVEAINLLCFASDKYEAAVSLFRCKCHGGVCRCKKAFSAHVNLRSSMENNTSKDASWRIGERVHVKGFADAVIVPREEYAPYPAERLRIQYDDGSHYYVLKDQLQKLGQSDSVRSLLAPNGNDELPRILRPLMENQGEVSRFDEYKCAEKIDYEALKRLRIDLSRDSDARRSCMSRLQQSLFRTETDEEHLKRLQRCHVLELIVEDLYGFLKDLSPDKDGCVIHEVIYEHRDASCRGRLFAKGRKIECLDYKYPRTSTLQGMHSDLRAALVGKFAHDIDCENSEFRLVCSLASQLGLEELIPTIIDYRDNRKEWLERIASVHHVSESDAKRLPNIIMSGGRYETWLRAMGTEASSIRCKPLQAKELKSFVYKLYAETHAIRDQLLGHGRFQWTSIEREKLKKEGRRDREIDSVLMPRIVQCCENEVLGIIHRSFEDIGWRVRAKVFDGLITEDPSRTMNLSDALKAAEAACLSRGWNVRLIEKPLHGLQDEPIKTIQQARNVIDRRYPYY